jgi:hypothetical protein|tara:strand:- start:95 stop:568 length:474 start_codon:yes stop_codon:yes gene_type:complete
MINRIDTKSVKIIRLVSGEEICCKFPLHKNQLPENSKLLRLQEPMLIKYVPRITEQGISDYIALVRWVGFTDEKIVTIPIDKIVTICNATPAFTKRYDGLTKTLKNSKQALPGFIERNMTDDELDQFADSDPYERDIDKRDIKEVADLLKMPSKKIH